MMAAERLSTSWRLQGLLDGIAAVPDDLDVPVSGIGADSRGIRAGEIFVARRGATTDGARFIDEAVAAGAAAIVFPVAKAAAVAGGVDLVPVVITLMIAAGASYATPIYQTNLMVFTAGGYKPSGFWRVGLPLARPAVAAGTAIVMMETVNDFGTVDHFAVQTLTTGIFTLWLQTSNAPGAAQIACLILMLVIVLVTLEKFSRRKSRFSVAARASRRIGRIMPR